MTSRMKDRVGNFLAQTPATAVLMGINVLVFVIETLAGGSRNAEVAYLFGAQATPWIEQGQVWRLFTAMFLHFGLMHIVCNMWSLSCVGPGIEHFFGVGRYLAIYLGAGLLGNLSTWGIEHITGIYAVSAGASGAIFGVFGAYLALYLLPSMRGRVNLRAIVITLILNVAYGLTYANVNMVAHFGGLAGGALIAALFIIAGKLAARRRLRS